jgi:hypothetical protein
MIHESTAKDLQKMGIWSGVKNYEIFGIKNYYVEWENPGVGKKITND